LQIVATSHESINPVSAVISSASLFITGSAPESQGKPGTSAY
jgi:hypothetical protein